MSRTDELELTGKVIKTLRNSKFIVLVDDANTEVTCTISGKLRQNSIHILLNDTVRIAMSPYDLTKGRIIWRNP